MQQLEIPHRTRPETDQVLPRVIDMLLSKHLSFLVLR
jgi:hypothetical protein